MLHLENKIQGITWAFFAMLWIAQCYFLSKRGQNLSKFWSLCGEISFHYRFGYSIWQHNNKLYPFCSSADITRNSKIFSSVLLLFCALCNNIIDIFFHWQGNSHSDQLCQWYLSLTLKWSSICKRVRKYNKLLLFVLHLLHMEIVI